MPGYARVAARFNLLLTICLTIFPTIKGHTAIFGRAPDENEADGSQYKQDEAANPGPGHPPAADLDQVSDKRKCDHESDAKGNSVDSHGRVQPSDKPLPDHCQADD